MGTIKGPRRMPEQQGQAGQERTMSVLGSKPGQSLKLVWGLLAKSRLSKDSARIQFQHQEDTANSILEAL
jgi:hypothetical protein